MTLTMMVVQQRNLNYAERVRRPLQPLLRKGTAEYVFIVDF